MVDLFYFKKKITDFFQSIPEKKYLKNIKTYKENLVAVDFSHKDINFYFDLIPGESGNFRAEISLRPDSIKLVNFKIQHIEEMHDFNKLQKKCAEIIKLIDDYILDFSIIIPVYNRENIISVCINSLNNIDYDPKKFEIIFIDDKSSDNSVEIISSTIDKNLNYRIFERASNSGGASAPRNDGMKIAKGKYIFFCDSDDEVEPDLFKNGMDIIRRNNSDLVYVKVGGSNRSIPIRAYEAGSVNSADISKNHLLRCNGPYKFYRRKNIIKNNLLFNPSLRLAEDKLFNFLFLITSKNTSILADKIYYKLSSHDGEHLSKTKTSFQFWVKLYSDMLCNLYYSDLNESDAQKLFNAILNRVIESYLKFFYKNTENSLKNYKNYIILRDLILLRKHWIDPSLIYPNLTKGFVSFFGLDEKAFFISSKN